jgi:hypothetical protein
MLGTPPTARYRIFFRCIRRDKEFLRFLRHIDRLVKKPRNVHLIFDTYTTPKTPDMMAWLE